MISFRLLSSYAWSSTAESSHVAVICCPQRQGPVHVDHIFSKSPASELDMNVHFGMFIRALRSWIIQHPITSFLVLTYVGPSSAGELAYATWRGAVSSGGCHCAGTRSACSDRR